MNPTEQFRESVESALDPMFGLPAFDGPRNPTAEDLDQFHKMAALASIQASTVELLEGLKAQVGNHQPDPDYYAQAIDEYIKDLGGTK